jgi:hypothetical protein
MKGGQLFHSIYRWEFEIRNAGQIEVGDLYLHLPFTGVYTVSNKPAEGLSELKEGKIHLGSLQSRDEVTYQPGLLTPTAHMMAGFISPTRKETFLSKSGSSLMVPVSFHPKEAGCFGFGCW